MSEEKKIRLSASQILLFLRCKKAWYYRYIEKVKEEKKPWLVKGINFHNCIEDIINRAKGGEDKEKYYSRDILDMVKVAFDMGILYVPDTCIVEKHINFNIMPGVSMTGKIDLVDVTGSKIVDHKTFSRKQYLLNEDGLKNDLQLNLYGYWYLNKLPKKKHLTYRHNQLNKINVEGSLFTEVEVHRDDVFHYWGTKITPAINEIWDMYQTCDKYKYVCNLQSCGDYGGCSYLKQCKNER